MASSAASWASRSSAGRGAAGISASLPGTPAPGRRNQQAPAPRFLLPPSPSTTAAPARSKNSAGAGTSPSPRTVKSARLLIARGVDPSAKNKYGKTAAELWVSQKPQSAGLMRLAKSLGAQPSLHLYQAVEQGRLTAVRKMLRKGAAANSRFPTGSKGTLLHTAAWNGDLAMAKLLVASGADVHALDEEHKTTPAHWARVALKIFDRKNCEPVAEYLEKHDKVTSVRYPGLREDPAYERARKYLPKGAGAIVTFELPNAKAFIDKLKLFSLLANVGDSKSLVIHPASTTHQQLSPEERLLSGITEDTVRLSVGIESIEDIIGDLEAAFKAV